MVTLVVVILDLLLSHMSVAHLLNNQGIKFTSSEVDPRDRQAEAKERM